MRNTWIYSLNSIPLGISPYFGFSLPRNNEQVWCQNLKLSTRHSCETQRDNCETKSWAESGAEEPSLTPQGFIRLLQPNLAPLMNKPRWFSPVCPTSALLGPQVLTVTRHRGEQASSVLSATALSLAATCHHTDVCHTRVTCFQSCTWMRLLGLQSS